MTRSQTVTEQQQQQHHEVQAPTLSAEHYGNELKELAELIVVD